MNASSHAPAILSVVSCDLNQWFVDEVRPHEPALRAYLQRRFPSLSDLDDVIQETYIRIIRAHESGRVRSLRPLLLVTARNVAFDVFRRESAVPTVELSATENTDALIDRSPTENPAHEQELQLLEAAIQSLPERCREVVLLKKIHGLSYNEISKKLGISHCTISAHITTGVTKCREYLRAHGMKAQAP